MQETLRSLRRVAEYCWRMETGRRRKMNLKSEDADLEFLMKILKELDIRLRQQEEKSSKLKAAMEKKKSKKMTKNPTGSGKKTSFFKFISFIGFNYYTAR